MTPPTTTEQMPQAKTVRHGDYTTIYLGINAITMRGFDAPERFAETINSAIAEARADERRKVIEEAAQACRDELVDADSTGEQSDYVYNRACNDCIDAIRSLLPQQDKQT